MVLEVDVQVLAPRDRSALSCMPHETCVDTATTCVVRDHHILKPGVNQPVPNDVRETDEVVAVSCDDRTEAVTVDEINPIPLGGIEDPSTERFRVKGIDLRV